MNKLHKIDYLLVVIFTGYYLVLGSFYFFTVDTALAYYLLHSNQKVLFNIMTFLADMNSLSILSQFSVAIPFVLMVVNLIKRNRMRGFVMFGVFVLQLVIVLAMKVILIVPYIEDHSFGGLEIVEVTTE